jgi:hypothetical protein
MRAGSSLSSHSNAVLICGSLPEFAGTAPKVVRFFHNSIHRNLVFTAIIALTSSEQLFSLSSVDG